MCHFYQIHYYIMSDRWVGYLYNFNCIINVLWIFFYKSIPFKWAERDKTCFRNTPDNQLNKQHCKAIDQFMWMLGYVSINKENIIYLYLGLTNHHSNEIYIFATVSSSVSLWQQIKASLHRSCCKMIIFKCYIMQLYSMLRSLLFCCVVQIF